MPLIFKTVALSWWEVGVVKAAVFCLALAIGATWPQAFAPYAAGLAALGLAFGMLALAIWLRKKPTALRP